MLDFAELLPFTQNSEVLTQKVESIKTAGSKNFEIVADFDGTLTTGKLPDGSKISTFGLFRCFYANPKYRDEAQALFDHYYPLEVDENIEIETKNLHMEKWWIQHLSLIISLGITKSQIMDFAVQQETFVRHGFGRFDHIVDFYDIPTTIFSAGLGDIVQGMLNYRFATYTINSNFFQFNDAGIATDYYNPIIHSHNKTSKVMQGLCSAQRPNKRNNVLLLGDSLVDANMVNDTDFETVLRIGFCSNEKLLPQFQSVYDVVLPNEESLDIVSDLIEHII
jgi:HAD superfamily hydrolase (TIGR01544 family)